MTEDRDRFPYGNPSSEYMREKGYDKPREIFEHNKEVSTHDMLIAVLCSADAIWDELRRIRMMMEQHSGRPVSRPTDQE